MSSLNTVFWLVVNHCYRIWSLTRAKDLHSIYILGSSVPFILKFQLKISEVLLYKGIIKQNSGVRSQNGLNAPLPLTELNSVRLADSAGGKRVFSQGETLRANERLDFDS
ncbi:hypothetical protein [Nostoc sp.]